MLRLGFLSLLVLMLAWPVLAQEITLLYLPEGLRVAANPRPAEKIPDTAEFSGRNLTFGQVEEYIYSVFSQAGRENAVIALAVSLAENHSRKCDVISPVNPNGTRDYGPMQMNSAHMDDYPMFDFTDCAENIQAGFLHFSRYGWKRWTTFRTGAYRRHLDRYRSFTPPYSMQVIKAP